MLYVILHINTPTTLYTHQKAPGFFCSGNPKLQDLPLISRSRSPCHHRNGVRAQPLSARSPRPTAFSGGGAISGLDGHFSEFKQCRRCEKEICETPSQSSLFGMVRILTTPLGDHEAEKVSGK